MIKIIAVIGAGTMGSGIALSCASSGFRVILFDSFPGALEKGKGAITKNINYLLKKEKINQDTASDIHSNIVYASEMESCKADLIIEAVIEKADAKIAVFHQLAKINDRDSIFASNTSSLSINKIQKEIFGPERFAGLHFFNPANLMKLVEVVKGDQTNLETINTLSTFCKLLGKVPVVCNDSPGFIVNRVARNFYLESLRILESSIATPEMMDIVLENAGFKMGPFRLMDLIGMDINFAVSQSIYNALDKPNRLKPSEVQQLKVEQGKLGRKTGSGFYDYTIQTSA